MSINSFSVIENLTIKPSEIKALKNVFVDLKSNYEIKLENFCYARSECEECENFKIVLAKKSYEHIEKFLKQNTLIHQIDKTLDKTETRDWVNKQNDILIKEEEEKINQIRNYSLFRPNKKFVCYKKCNDIYKQQNNFYKKIKNIENLLEKLEIKTAK